MEPNAPTNSLYIDSSGAVGVGVANPTSRLLQVGAGISPSFMPAPDADRAAHISETVSDTKQKPTLMVGQEQTNAGGHCQVLEAYGVSNNSSGTMPLMLGVIGNIEHIGGGALTKGEGVRAGFFSNGAGTVTHGIGVNASYNLLGSGDITNGYGVHVEASDSGGGSVTTGYGVYIKDMVGSTTWGVYQEGTDDNLFNGKVKMAATPAFNFPKTSSTADPSTTEYPNDGDFGFHENTSTGNRFIAFNDGGTIYKQSMV